MERLNEIPEGADAELIEKHKDEIVSVTKDLMQAFLLDDKACVMNQRILKLAEQYEMYVQTYNPEGTSTATVDSDEEGAEQQTTIYTKDSVVFGKCHPVSVFCVFCSFLFLPRVATPFAIGPSSMCSKESATECDVCDFEPCIRKDRQRATKKTEEGSLIFCRCNHA